jgi:hypothetical protein
MFTLFPTAAEFGKRSSKATPEPETEPETAPGSAEKPVPTQP